MIVLFHENEYLGKVITDKDLTLEECINTLGIDTDGTGEFEMITLGYVVGDIISFKELTKEQVGIEHLVTSETFDLELGTHTEILHGTHSILLKGDIYLNIVFETNKPFIVIENDKNRVYKTIIDIDSIELKITYLDII